MLPSHRWLAEGRDYHRRFLDRYLPDDGLIGDIGCGEARIAAVYENNRRKFISIDNDPANVSAAREALPDSDIRLGDAFALPLPDASLDAYIGLGIFELDGARGQRAIKEAARVTKPGGLLYVTVPYANVARRRGAVAKWHGIELPVFSEAEMRELLADNWFKMTLARPSSIAHAVKPVGLAVRVFGLADEQGAAYDLFGWLFRPFANSLLVVGHAHSP
jgi:SAM-dependent methyltransferase